MVTANLKIRDLQGRLFLLACMYVLVGGILVSLLPDRPVWQGALAAIAIITGFGFVYHAWRGREFTPDPFLLPVLLMLTATGIFFLFRLNPFYGLRQLAWMMVGLCAFFLVTAWRDPSKFFAAHKYKLAVAGVLSLFIPVFWGTEVGGARNWLDFQLFYLQPSEFVKLLLIIFLAMHFAEQRCLLVDDGETGLKRYSPRIRCWGPVFGIWFVSLLLLVLQKDLGMALIYFAAFLALAYVVTDRLSYVLLGLGLFSLAGVIAYFCFSHVHTRVEIWLNPWQQDIITGSSYQIVQSLFAINAGGVLGSGFGAGHPSFIPAVHTDFIFAAICEEMGLLGGTGIIMLYMLLVFRGIGIALKARDEYSTLLAGGLTVIMGFQVFIIIAGVVKLLPLTGVTLPFISYGGSSLVANFILMGLLVNVSHHNGDFNE